jgi:hypothetical protein
VGTGDNLKAKEKHDVKNMFFPGCLLLFILFVMPWAAYPQPVKRTPRLVLQKRNFDFGKVTQNKDACCANHCIAAACSRLEGSKSLLCERP